MNKITLISIALVCVLLFSGCEKQISKEELIKNVLASAQSIKTYKTDSDIKMNMDISIFGSRQSVAMEMTLKGSVDLENRKIVFDVKSKAAGKEQKFTTYFLDNVAYMQAQGQWLKQTAKANAFATQNQYKDIIDLLQDSQIEILGQENVDGKSNYVINIIPDKKKLFEKSFKPLEQGAQKPQLPQGPNVDELVKDFTVKFWIQEDSFLVSKSMIRILIEPKNQTSIKMDMTMNTKIYEHNKPIIIELPEEAKKAVEISASETFSSISQKVGKGKECFTSSDCITNFCVKGICTEGKPGDPCRFPVRDCKEGLKCIGDKCREDYAEIGEACSSFSDCKSKICINNKCSEGNFGDECFGVFDCKSQKCVNHKCSEGIAGDACFFSFDCKQGLTCINKICG